MFTMSNVLHGFSVIRRHSNATYLRWCLSVVIWVTTGDVGRSGETL